MWLKIKMKLGVASYTNKFKRNNALYRRLIHSHKKVGGISNRNFFKENCLSISYRIDWLCDDEVQVVFFFRFKKESNENFIRTNTITRLKTVVFTPSEWEFVNDDKALPITYPTLFTNRKIKTKTLRK